MRIVEIIIYIFIGIFLSISSYACHDDPHRPSGEEIVCPAEVRPSSRDLKEKGLGIADMPIINEEICDVTDDKAGIKRYGLWCEHRKADKNPLIYIIVYSNQDRDMIRFILILNPQTEKTILFYDSEKKRDIILKKEVGLPIVVIL